MLTDARIRTAKAGAAPIKIADGGGLHLLVQPTGSKLWRQSYRFGKKQRTAALGAYPAVSLAEARTKREDVKRALREGRDPAAVRATEKAEKAAEEQATLMTFSVVAKEWWDTKVIAEGRISATTQNAKQWALKALKADIGKRPIAEIEPPELLKTLRKAAVAGAHEKVSRMRGLASEVFRFGIASGYCVRDPAADLKGALTANQSKPHAAVIASDDIGELLRAIDGVDHSLVRPALQLLALTAARPGELVSMEWSEIDGGTIWNLPAHKTKMRRPHRIPLSTQARAVLEEMRKLTGGRLFVFASSRLRDGRIDKKALNVFLTRIGFGFERHVAHGFRATFSSNANASKLWSPDAIERHLAHLDRDTVRRAYDRDERWDERVAMMQWWADQLDAFRARPARVA